MSAVTKWLIGLAVIWVLFTVIACICEAAWTPAGGLSKIDTLLNPQFSIDGIRAFVATFWDMLQWDYPFLSHGVFQLLQYIGRAISAVVGIIIVVELVQIGATALGKLFGLAR
jgi:hypothetical protein